MKNEEGEVLTGVKTFSIELHKANLLGLEVQYYPYPAPLSSPFQAGPALAQMPKLPAQM